MEALLYLWLAITIFLSIPTSGFYRMEISLACSTRSSTRSARKANEIANSLVKGHFNS